MGCSSSRTAFEDEESSYKLHYEREKFHLRHDKFELLCKEMLRDIKRVFDEFDKNALGNMIEEIKAQKGSGDLSEQEMQLCLREFVARRIIEDKELLKEYDVYDYANQMWNDYKMFEANGMQADLAKILMENFTRVFPKFQKGVFLNLNEEDYGEFGYILAVFNNFKFNMSYQVETLNLVANNFFLKNYSLIQGLAEIVESNKNLMTFLIHVFDDNDKPIIQEMLASLNAVFISLSKCRFLRFLVIQTIDDGLFNLTPEIENCLLEIIQRDTLYGLYLAKFGLSDNFITNLTKLLPNMKNLRFLLIESKSVNTNLLDDFIIHGIGRNRSIQISLLAAFDIPETKVMEYKQVKKHNDVLKIFEYYKEFKL